MLIGICEIYLYFPNSFSLKDKRSILAGYFTFLRRKYNISIVELGQRNFRKNSHIGIACIGDNRQLIDRIMQKIINYTDTHHEMQLIDYHISIN